MSRTRGRSGDAACSVQRQWNGADCCPVVRRRIPAILRCHFPYLRPSSRLVCMTWATFSCVPSFIAPCITECRLSDVVRRCSVCFIFPALLLITFQRSPSHGCAPASMQIPFTTAFSCHRGGIIRPARKLSRGTFGRSDVVRGGGQAAGHA